MSTLVLNGSVPVGSQSVTFLGEWAGWAFAPGQTFLHADIVSALSAAGLNTTLALHLAPRNEFIRAVRKIAAGRIVGEVGDGPDSVTFQLDRQQQVGTMLTYNYECKCWLNVHTGIANSTDSALEALLRAEMANAKHARSLQDVNRLIRRAFDQETRDPLAVVSFIKGSGVYFVYQQWVPFLDMVAKFVTLLGGDCRRCPQVSGTVQGNAAVASAVADAIVDVIDDYERAILALNTDSTDKAISKAYQSIRDARDMIFQKADFLAAHRARLEDHLAYAESLLRKSQEATVDSDQQSLFVVV